MVLDSAAIFTIRSFVDVVMTVVMMNIDCNKGLYLALGSSKRRVQYNIFRGYDPYLP